MKSEKPIDMYAGYPDVAQTKFMQKHAPKCWELFFGKKYILPQYRQPHYAPQDFVNYMEWATLIGLRQSAYRDDIMNACYCNTAGGLYHGRPTLFLEKELGRNLIKAQLPEEMMAHDIKWRWPAMRIYLPKGLIPFKDKWWMMFLDIGSLEENEGRSIPPALAEELNHASEFMHPDEPRYLDFKKFHFFYPDRAIVLSGIMNCIDGTDTTDLTTYAMVKPFKNYTIQQIKGMTEHLKSAWKCEKADDVVTAKMEHLAIQILLYLSAFPELYQPDTVLRKPSQKGERRLSGLYAAKFVGKSQRKPDYAGETRIKGPPTGLHLPAMERSGHWKRQPCGIKWGERRLIWVESYYTTGEGYEPNAEQDDQ